MLEFTALACNEVKSKTKVHQNHFKPSVAFTNQLTKSQSYKLINKKDTLPPECSDG